MMWKSTLIFLLLGLWAAAEETNPKGFIETRRLFLFDSTNGLQADKEGDTYSFTFSRNFTVVPRVGLAVYTMDFEYSPTFSCKVTSDTTTSTANLLINTANTGQNNQLYIMYMATDHDYMGVFMPGPLVTYMLNQGAPEMTQSFQFNFKSQIASNTQSSNIRLSVYLTGITSSSELVSNGYPTNHTSFFMTSKVLSPTNYQIDVSVKSLYGDITISQVEYTIIYFDVGLMLGARYQMDSGMVALQNYGGTTEASQKSITLTPLPYNADYDNQMLFYGISGLECKQGNSIALSAVHSFYVSPSNNETQVLLTMETWKLTSIIHSEYNFILYQSLRCGLPGANCDGNCLTSTIPHFVVAEVCNFCQQSCLTCDVSNTNTKCDTCDVTRVLSNKTGLCLCKSGFYDSLQSNVCQDCFPCLTCNRKGVCLSCTASLKLVLNPVLSICECGPGYYPQKIPNSTALNKTEPCLACAKNCLACLNGTFCWACTPQTYLSQGKCLPICSSNEKYNQVNTTCIFTSNAQFEQTGRLGYQWSYTANRSQLNILLTFSQPNTQYYYYENGIGYSKGSSEIAASQMQTAQFYFDDGQNSAGYNTLESLSAQQAGGVSLNSNAGAIFGNAKLDSEGDASAALASTVSSGNLLGGMDSSALNGSFYGLGEQQFFKYLYYNYEQTHNMKFNYFDKWNIPYGKYNLSTNQALRNPNYVDALASNLAIVINNQSLSYAINSNSNNQFAITATVPQSYHGEHAYVVLKNPALVRSGSTAAQLNNVSQPIYIYDCAVPLYVTTANGIYDSNSVIIQVLWGLGKYPLFLGFGWIFLPLMLSLQFIMSFNYIETTKPLNLDMFLSSFADFRNPSIFYNPVRGDMDRSVISHKEMYMSVQGYNRFDRGIDFMKNCFQFFLVPALSFLLWLLLFGINKLLINYCKRDITLISNYLVPRLPLHIAAYVLVQALPVSFFFFGQLNDTKFSSPAQPNSAYPIFNIAMSYLSFFLTCAIPLMLMAHLYFSYSHKQNKVKSAKEFKNLFTNILQSLPADHKKAILDDPLWSGDTKRIITYGFGATVFFLCINYGFFTSFFMANSNWQIAGLIVVSALFMAFAAAGDHFDSKMIKVFWILFSALLIAFLLLLAAMGSTRSVAACDLENLGYLGIGFLYMLIVLSLIMCLYLLWQTCLNLYFGFFKSKRMFVNLEDNKPSEIDQKPDRIKAFESSKSFRSNYMKHPSVHMGQNKSSSKMQGGSMNMGLQQRHEEDNIHTEDRMIIREENDDAEDDDVAQNMRQKLRFLNIDPKTGEYVYISEKTNKMYRFDAKMGRHLRDKEPLYIDTNDVLFDCDLRYLGNYSQIISQEQDNKTEKGEKTEVKDNINIKVSAERKNVKAANEDDYADLQIDKLKPVISHTESEEDDQQQRIIRKGQVNITNIYIINGQEYSKEGEDSKGQFLMRNKITGERITISPDKLKLQEELIQQENESVQFSRRGVQASQKPITTHAISPQIERNQVQLKKNRKIKVNQEELLDMGEENGMFKLYNSAKKMMQKVSRQQYIKLNILSFENRININGLDYDFEREGPNKSIHLVEIYTRKPKVIKPSEFARVKMQNEQAFRTMIGDSFRAKVEEALTKPPKPIEEFSMPNNLLIQSKAGRNEVLVNSTDTRRTVQNEVYQSTKTNYDSNSNAMNINRNSTSVKEVEMIQFTSHRHVQEDDDEEGESVEKVLQESPGPFQLFVIPMNKVDAQDHYLPEDSIETIMLDGTKVMTFMDMVEKKYPKAALFMKDLSNSQEYRLI